MYRRREILGAGGVSMVALAGCSRFIPDDDPPPEREPETPTETETEPTPREDEEAVVNVREMGAEGDGETDDTEAILQAFEEAVEGDTVYFPGGTYLVSVRNSPSDYDAIPLYGNHLPDDLTVEGAGDETILLMDGGHSITHIALRVYVQDGVEGLVIRDLVIDGNREQQDTALGREVGMCLLIRNATEEAEGGIDITVEDVEAVRANMNGVDVMTGGVELNRVTAVDNGLHGIGADSFNDAHVYDPPIVIRNSYAARNGIDFGVGYGIDVSGGKVVVEDCISEGNAQGSKTTEQVLEATYRRVVFRDNRGHGYIRPNTPTETGQRARVTFDDVLSESNDGLGFRFGQDTDYEIGTIVARNNHHRDGNILIRENASIEADEIWSLRAENGPTFWYSGTGTFEVKRFVHDVDEEDGIPQDDSGLVIETVEQIDDDSEQNGALGNPDNVQIPNEGSVGVTWN